MYLWVMYQLNSIHICFIYISACPDTLIFTSTPVGEIRTVRCSTLSDLLYSGIISARCGGEGEWELLDLSQCTFRELPNKILLLKATDTNIRNYVSLTELLRVYLIQPNEIVSDGSIVYLYIGNVVYLYIYREYCVLVVYYIHCDMIMNLMVNLLNT